MYVCVIKSTLVASRQKPLTRAGVCTMGGEGSRKKGIPEEHNKLQGLLDPLRKRGFAV